MRVDLFFRRLKRNLGLYGIALPIENLDQFILEIIEDTTLPTFSLYVPRIEIHNVELAEMRRGDNDRGDDCELYILPDRLFNGREVLFVRRVEYLTQIQGHVARYPTAIMPGINNAIGLTFEDILLANASKPLVDNLIPPLTFHYEHPKKLYIYDAMMGSSFKITLACVHDNSLQSIPPTAGESFYQLAELDVMAGLYEFVKHYEDIGGAYDKTQLKIEKWQQAGEARRTLVEKWDESYGLDGSGFDFG